LCTSIPDLSIHRRRVIQETALSAANTTDANKNWIRVTSGENMVKKSLLTKLMMVLTVVMIAIAGIESFINYKVASAHLS
jgi:hypothetical protein